MTDYLTKWSLTRRKVFTKCARRFAIKYLHDSKKLDRKKIQSNRVSDWDLMIKSTRSTFFDLMKDAHLGKSWSENLLKSRLHFELITNLANSKSPKIAKWRKEYLLDLGMNRIRKLVKQKIIRKLIEQKITNWSVQSRIKPTSMGHIEVYCSPDIVYKLNNKWHLVRINFQSEKNQPYLDLELCSMLLWSKKNQYLPDIDNKFIIHGISFDKGNWYQKSIIPSKNMLQEVKQLLEKDVHQMNVLNRLFARTLNPNDLPMAKSTSYCKRCPYRQNCPKLIQPNTEIQDS